MRGVAFIVLAIVGLWLYSRSRPAAAAPEEPEEPAPPEEPGPPAEDLSEFYMPPTMPEATYYLTTFGYLSHAFKCSITNQGTGPGTGGGAGRAGKVLSGGMSLLQPRPTPPFHRRVTSA